MARFINSFGYKESTLKSDTELAIIAFRNRVAAMCKAEVATEDAVKGDKEPNGLIEKAIMLLRGFEQSSPTLRAGCRNHSTTTRLSCHGWWSTPDASRPGVRKVVMGRRHFERLHGKKPTEEFVPFGEEVLARQITTDPRNRMNPDISAGFGLGCETTAQSASLGTQTVYIQSS